MRRSRKIMTVERDETCRGMKRVGNGLRMVTSFH